MNREIVLSGGGAGIYPLIGDVVSTAGNTTVVVAGLQNVPISSNFPGAGNNLQYNPNTNQWTPTPVACVAVDGVVVSYDYEIAVNMVSPPITVS